MSRNIRIHSDGTARQTVIFDEEGVKLERVKHIEISIDAADDRVDVALEISHSSVDVRGSVNHIGFVCPCCDEVLAHMCSDDNSSMASGVWNPLMQITASNTPAPVPALPITGSSTTVPVVYNKYHNGVPLLEFNVGSTVSRKQTQIGECSFEIEGIPTGVLARLKLSCIEQAGHRDAHHHNDGVDNFYWSYKGLAPTYRA